jgi:hypothetical protein
MVFDKLTWIGFMITAFGWTLLLAAPQVMEVFASLTGRSGVYLNMPAIAQCAILTGLGLAIVGAVQTGFGALNTYFEAILERTGKMRPKSAGPAKPQKK